MTIALDEAAKGGGTNRSGSRDPDPTDATVQMLMREISALKELTAQQNSSVERAVQVAHDDLVRVPTEVQKAIGGLKELIHAEFLTVEQKFLIQDEKFASIEKQFKERDIRTEQAQRDSKVAVDAALQAAKEAVGKQQDANDRATTKSENSVSKLIEQQAELLAAQKAELTNRIEANKENLARMSTDLATLNQTLLTRAESIKDSRDSTGAWIAGAAAIVAIFVSVAGVIVLR